MNAILCQVCMLYSSQWMQEMLQFFRLSILSQDLVCTQTHTCLFYSIYVTHTDFTVGRERKKKHLFLWCGF